MADSREPSTTDGPRPPRQAVDPRCRTWWLAQWLAAIVIIVVPLVVLGVLIPPARLWLILPAVIVTIVGLACAVLQPRLSFRIHRWEVTEDAVYSRTGWLWQEWRAAPLSRVQTVDLVRGPLQQRFGLATVTVTTASAKGAVKLEALAAEEADELVQRLTVLTEAGAAAESADGTGSRDAT